MESDDRSPQRQRELYARILVDWHSAVDVSELRRRFEGNREWFTRYQQAVGRFRESDLADLEVQRAIAEEQISGSMEWASGEAVPEDSLERDPETGSKSLPRTLGEIARKLREALSTKGEQHRRTIGFTDHEDLLEQAKDFYAPFVSRDVQGAGGLSFLLSCSLERAARAGAHQVVLLSPDVLGADQAPPGRPGDLLTEIGRGVLEIEDVSGETS